jgi:DNA primase
MIDFFRKDRGSTAVTHYSTRARPSAPVATPLEAKQSIGVEALRSMKIP